MMTKGSFRAKTLFFSYLAAAVLQMVLFSEVSAERIKDIGTFAGIRENELVGYGIVVG